MNAVNSSQQWVGGEVGLLLSQLIYINNTATSHFSWCFFSLDLKHLARSVEIYTLTHRTIEYLELEGTQDDH